MRPTKKQVYERTKTAAFVRDVTNGSYKKAEANLKDIVSSKLKSKINSVKSINIF